MSDDDRQAIYGGITVWVAVIMIFLAVQLWTQHCAPFMPLPYAQVPIECMRLLIVR
jgi:hypothetical protein